MKELLSNNYLTTITWKSDGYRFLPDQRLKPNLRQKINRKTKGIKRKSPKKAG